MKKIILSFSLILIISILGLRVFKQEKVLNNELLTNKLDSMVGVYIEDENGEYISSSDIPQKDGGYTFNHAVCENDVEVTWDEENWVLLGPNNITNWKCNLYFDKTILAKNVILANYPTVLTRTDFSQTVTTTTTGTIYKSLDESQYDNDGEVYYFAGNPTDNWVQFGGFYWRIIRINGNGTIRLIYQGKNANASGNDALALTNVPFNSDGYDAAYVGYMYGNITKYSDGIQNSTVSRIDFSQSELSFGSSYVFNNEDGTYNLAGNIEQANFSSRYVGDYTCGSYTQTGRCMTLYQIQSYIDSDTANVYKITANNVNNLTYNQVHQNTNDSTIKTQLDSWYKNNLSNYSPFLDKNSGFCNDRTAYLDEEGKNLGGGIGHYDTYFGAKIRLNKFQPSFKCDNENDLFTVNDSIIGNNDLTYPIGLITVDEIAFAGGVHSIRNEMYYLNVNTAYWTMSPSLILRDVYNYMESN